MANESVVILLKFSGGYMYILIFMNYLYFSETPAYTVGFSKYVFCRNPQGQFDNLEA
jgi:hypothetical protein